MFTGNIEAKDLLLVVNINIAEIGRKKNFVLPCCNKATPSGHLRFILMLVCENRVVIVPHPKPFIPVGTFLSIVR